MKFFNKTAFVVLLTALATIACTNQEVVEDMNYKNDDIKEIEVTRLVDEQQDPVELNSENLPSENRGPIIHVKRDRD